MADLARVAEIYTSAYADGRSPVKAVAAEFGVAYPTAAKYVSEARKASHLPATSPGNARAVEGVLRGGKLSVRFTAPHPGTYHLGLGAAPHLATECPPECHGHPLRLPRPDTTEANDVLLAVLVDRLGGSVTVTEDELLAMRESPRHFTAFRNPTRWEWTLALLPEPDPTATHAAIDALAAEQPGKEN